MGILLEALLRLGLEGAATIAVRRRKRLRRLVAVSGLVLLAIILAFARA